MPTSTALPQFAPSPELSHSGSQSPVLSSITSTMRLVPPSPTGTPWRSTPSCHPWQRRPPFLFLVRQQRNEVCLPFPPTFRLLPPLSLHIFPSLYFFNSPILPRFSLFCLPLLFLPPPPLPLSSFNNSPLPCTSPSTLLAGFSPRRPLPLPIPLSHLTRPHALPPFMARSWSSRPRRIGSTTWFLRRSRQYACQRHDGSPLTCYRYIRR